MSIVSLTKFSLLVQISCLQQFCPLLLMLITDFIFWKPVSFICYLITKFLSQLLFYCISFPHFIYLLISCFIKLNNYVYFPGIYYCLKKDEIISPSISTFHNFSIKFNILSLSACKP